MNPIISNSSATFKKWLALYLDHNSISQFLAKDTEPNRVANLNQVKTEIITLQCDVQHIRATVKLSVKRNQRWLALANRKRKIIKSLKDTIDHALIDDLIFDDHRNHPHVMNHDDLLKLRSKLLNYLKYHLPITQKIKWILKHKTISDKTLGRKVILEPNDINDFRTGKKKITMMKLESATRIVDYYDSVVDKQLMKY